MTREKSIEYKTWESINRRCHNPRQQNYKLYGARGVRVADEWRGRGGFARFLAHIGPKPSPAHSIDRIDNTRGYEPGNVRWATASEQARNKSNLHFIEANGERLPLAEWAKRLDCDHTTIIGRLNRGWDPALAVTKPTRVWTHRRAS